MVRLKLPLPLLSLLLTLAACEPQQDTAAHAQPAPAPDSVPTIDEQIRRFKAGLVGSAPTAFTGGATSRDALVAMLISAVEANDRAKADSMAMNVWEFIELYYPHTPFVRPPYELDPQHVWLLARADNDKGFRRLFDRYGADQLHFESYSCSADPEQQERNRIWSKCVVRWNPSRGAPREMEIFAAIIERDGHFKFLSYANDF